jgi:hypothetical protein
MSDPRNPSTKPDDPKPVKTYIDRVVDGKSVRVPMTQDELAVATHRYRPEELRNIIVLMSDGTSVRPYDPQTPIQDQ